MSDEKANMNSKAASAWPYLRTVNGNFDIHELTIDQVLGQVRGVVDDVVLVYYNLPFYDHKMAGTPDININVLNGRLLKFGLGACFDPWTTRPQILPNIDHTGCVASYHHGLRWLAVRGIESVIKEGLEAEPFLRYLDSLWD